MELVWRIERREIVEEIYQMADGRLSLRPQFYNTRGWPDGEPELYTPILLDCFDHGGIFLGAFAREHLVAASVVDARPVGDYPNLRQLAFLHVSHDWRGKKLAVLLYQWCMDAAVRLGAAGFYISSTPTRRTVEFYLRKGAKTVALPDKTLVSLEPEDIHLIHWF
ncbi:putative N-acetyltransferase YhbS [Mycoplana sp. BE70]|uniref:N-acetyltransferase n=1 Tax=Mycoplana sp. BE70 TaxID=2817775 RepID=UPI002862BCFE|nr:N-acetyltransferase [Mycoplana sp. BE70]MDR6758775.1 putative N-acetyltransferase YhbS [Mycoplana sp. BE70]